MIRMIFVFLAQFLLQLKLNCLPDLQFQVVTGQESLSAAKEASMNSWSDQVSCEIPLDARKPDRNSVLWLVRGIVLSCAAIFTLPAMANLVSPITVNLLAPGGYTDGTITDTTPISFTQTVDYGSPITSAGSGAISGFMLTDEQIALSLDSILIRAVQGDSLGGTGYLGFSGNHALYRFNGLSITGRTITGFNVYDFDGYGTSGFTGLTSGLGVSLVGDTLTFNLDDLLFFDRGLGQSNNFADFRIDILSTPNTPSPPPNGVPEPGSLILVTSALFALWPASNRRLNGRLARCETKNV